ncbi:MAG: rhodanese-like domain-containing protein [Myxococcota bacterium]|nr:rhodanese-like domain-containing protein [Myxococcota bacterium]
MKSIVLILLVLLLSCVCFGVGVKDAEEAAHSNEAARYYIVDTYKYDSYELVQFTLAVLSHYSYILVSGSDALVVDPGRDVQTYVKYAKERNLKIVGVFLTHSHADFVAGHVELQRATGAPIYAGYKSGAQFKHTAVKNQSKIKVGRATLTVLETPGHTPDGLCGLVGSIEGKPDLLFTGDTLFVGSVGRPDLLEGQMSAAGLASMSFDTWHQVLSKLPDTVSIFPAHGAGSLCGANLSDEPTSTLGQQRAENPYLQYANRSEFITAVLQDLPEAPQYFKHNAALNRKGPPLVNWQAPSPPIRPQLSLSDPGRYYVVDLREAKEYAPRHIPNSVNIALRGRVETWVGIMVPWEANLVLVGHPDELREATQRLHRVGYTGKGLTWEKWEKAGLPTATNKLVQPKQLYEMMQNNTSPVVVDVRLPKEWMGVRIGKVLNLPLNHLAELSAKLDPNEPVVTVCNSAFRSSMAVGVLEREGFKDAASLDGGGKEWIKLGLPTMQAKAAGKGAAQAVPLRSVALPERMQPASLNRLMLDLPGSFEIVDIRPPQAFADFHLPGSTNLHIADLIADPAYLVGNVPLIIVDRDGTLAMAAGGILAQKTGRPIRVLSGGLSQYWRESNLPRGTLSPIPAGEPAPAASPGTAPAPVAPPAQPQKQSKRPSAGC